MPDSPFAVFRNVPRLLLGQGAQDREKELSTGIHRADILLLKDDSDPQCFEPSGVLQAVLCVSGKSGNGFCDHKIYFSGFAVHDHPIKSLHLSR